MTAIPDILHNYQLDDADVIASKVQGFYFPPKSLKKVYAPNVVY